MTGWDARLGGGSTGLAQGVVEGMILDYFDRAMAQYDPRNWGAKLDARRISATTTVSSTTITGSFLASNGDAGKRIRMTGAGAVVASGSDASMTAGSNIVTSASASFSSALWGREITIAGAGPGGAPLRTQVWGIISATQLRTTNNASTSTSAQAFAISEDLFAAITASTSTTATVDTAAATAVVSQYAYVATDDSAAIRQCIIDAVAANPSATQLTAPTIRFVANFGMASTVEVTARVRLLGGAGILGVSQLLNSGAVKCIGLAPNMQAYFRGAYIFGSNGSAPTGSGLGLRGNMTVGSAVLTALDGSFVPGDAGKRIAVVGAGIPSGSLTESVLNTTIASVQSTTQVTLAAPANQTVTDATYSWLGASVGATISSIIEIERIHLIGGPSQMCGVHLCGLNAWLHRDVTTSDFRSGVGLYADGGTIFSQTGVIDNPMFYNCRIALKAVNALLSMTGAPFFDGNNNFVSVQPGPGTIGIDAATGAIASAGAVNIQAFETSIRGGLLNFPSLRLEGFMTAIDLCGDTGQILGNGSSFNCFSWSSGFAGAVGLKLRSNVKNTVFQPGYYLQNDFSMYGACDPTSLSLTKVIDPLLDGEQVVNYGASIGPELGIGSTVIVTLTGDTSVGRPMLNGVLNLAVEGHRLTYIFKQDAVGGRAFSFNTFYLKSFTAVTTPNTYSIITFVRRNGFWVQEAFQTGLA